ncbi:uncharacterized protein PRCAT00001504001 [Priceomyces carsonii]|uniref:uncharacterized protein n=1 Tax=Priceomyces carsonii TaxID=28549 RepID=UPI002ED7C0C8|nr:unnamed protein product [Priceomyces carsonii]
MKLSAEGINEIQKDATRIRNICILAHVDHGKTSLSDSLLATNGIISQRMAGKVRYLDSREDEQTRGITMEASAISLYFKVLRRQKESEDTETKEYLVNLIDSPGHIDFSSEVSTASRLCDGAVVLVDVVEGVCSQTVNVLRQCWVDKLKPLLVLNKIDRLITEWKLTPAEAYEHLRRIIEQVNSVIGLFYSGERMEDDMIWREKGELDEFVEKDDEDIYFNPEKNNVIFASAVDGWAFSVNTFARIYLTKLGFSQTVLSKTLWGDFYLDMKNKKIIPGNKLKAGSSLKHLFVTLILEQIWSVYQYCILERDQTKLEKIITKLGSKVSSRDLRSKDHKNLLNSIMSQWIPLSHAVLGAVIDYLPDPRAAQLERIDKILDQCYFDLIEDKEKETLLNSSLIDSLRYCKSASPDLNTVAYVSKLISIPADELPKDAGKGSVLTQEELIERGKIARELARKASQITADSLNSNDELANPPSSSNPFQFEYEEDFEDDDDDDDDKENVDDTNNEVLVAFTRVYSGSLSRGQKITVVGPKYNSSLPKDDPTNEQQVFHDIEIQDLFVIMGRDLLRVDYVPAGNIIGVVGLEKVVLKNATLYSERDVEMPYINFSSASTLIHNKPIMKIAIEPNNPIKLSKLEKGLDLLARADPVFEWYVDDESGELIVCVAGELHLERCLKDLQERFAKGCDVVVKEPVIPFREGIANDKVENSSIANLDPLHEGIDVDIDVVPLPEEVVRFLIDNESTISSIADSRRELPSELVSLKESLVRVLKASEFKFNFKDLEHLVNKIIAFGPKRYGPNIFVESDDLNLFKCIFDDKKHERKFEYETSIINGFQLATNEGPLASEPLQGVLVILKSCETSDSNAIDKSNNFSGRLMTYTRDLIHKVFLRKSPRFLLAMYTCEIQASSEVLGKVYAVVQRRGGSIISEEMKEGTPFFTVEARIPVVEAFGFSEDIRKKTSGAASPQLIFDGFDVLNIDPFWVPHTEEELEELGEFAERENIARRYMNTIRRRKGLFVDEKIISNAEKQRTLKKD